MFQGLERVWAREKDGTGRVANEVYAFEPISHAFYPTSDRRKDEASTDMPEEKKAKREVSSTSSKASVAKRRVVDSVMQQAIAAQQASMGQGGMGQAAMGHRVSV